MKPADVVPSLHRQRRQLQGGDPAFGAPLQRRDVAGRQVQAHHLVEVRRRLVGGEAQVGGADLDELAARAQPRQRQRRIGAAWRSPGGPAAAGARAGTPSRPGSSRRVDDVVVVEHQHDVVRDRAELVEQRGEDRLDRRRLGRLQQRERAGADPGHAPSASAAITYVQNDAGSLSPWSSESHAADRRPAGAAASHSASSVVLPKPAGAETSVSLDSAPRPRRSLRRGRGTTPRRSLEESLVQQRAPGVGRRHRCRDPVTGPA